MDSESTLLDLVLSYLGFIIYIHHDDPMEVRCSIGLFHLSDLVHGSSEGVQIQIESMVCVMHPAGCVVWTWSGAHRYHEQNYPNDPTTTLYNLDGRKVGSISIKTKTTGGTCDRVKEGGAHPSQNQSYGHH